MAWWLEIGLPNWIRCLAYERAAFLGEHTRQVLGELGYTTEQIDAMIAAGEVADVKRIG